MGNEFISTVSHELRTPMTSIKGALGLVLASSNADLSEQTRKILDIAHRNADRLINIINDLLDVERIEAGKMSFDLQVCDLTQVIDEAIAGNEAFAQRFGVTVHCEGEPHAFARVDFERTLQILNNLISNAAKHSNPGGKVLVRLGQDETSVTMSVQDFGRGIPVDFQDRIFEKFARNGSSESNGVRSTGLGLSIVKAMVEQQSGTITFDSEVGLGTTFCVTLPRA